MNALSPVLARFLSTRHGAIDIDIAQWHGEAVQQTPGADAWCRILVQDADAHSYRARFLAFGPPGVIAAADWLCEQVERRGLSAALCITAGEISDALSLTADERYIGVMVVDALATTASNLGR